MNTERAQVGWGFWLGWVLASTVGGAVGVAVGGLTLFIFVAFAVDADLDVVGKTLLGAVGFAVFGAVIGASLGIAQWLVLRRQVSEPASSASPWPFSWRLLWESDLGIAQWLDARVIPLLRRTWVLASTVGGTVGVAVGGTVGEVVGGAVGVAVAATVIGASLGIAQWLVLRRQVSRAGWWVLASTVGFVATFAVTSAVSFVVGGAMGGAITGAVLVWLLRQPRPEA
ncbi:MAG: hypothetical protein IIA89_07670 [Chloroflexi bacterium]|nr:hypothetical protein [Chloroflexota bacterium]